jgi:DNA-directed RNA polymerase specialized sigma subunit
MIRLAYIYPETLQKGDWRVIRNEITTFLVPMQMGPKLKQLTKRKPEYSEDTFPVLGVGGALIKVRRVWVAPSEDGPIIRAAIDYVKPVDKFTSWQEACREHPDDRIVAKGAAAFDRLAKWFRPLVGTVVNERKGDGNKRFWGRPRETLIALGMLGLTHAILDYDFSQNVRFSTFAKPKIRSAIHDGLRGSTLAERFLYANTKATVDEIVAGAGFENPQSQEAQDCAIEAVRKRDADKTMVVYDVRESGDSDDDVVRGGRVIRADGSDKARALVARSHINKENRVMARLHSAIARIVEQEAEEDEVWIERRVREIGRRAASIEEVGRIKRRA